MTATKKMEASSGYFEKQIGHTLYEVHCHFSNNGVEAVSDKILNCSMRKREALVFTSRKGTTSVGFVIPVLHQFYSWTI